MAAGIDYGMGQTNIDTVTGIRYGVIPTNDVLQAWSDESESQYGDPSCPQCGNDLVTLTDLDEELDDSYTNYNSNRFNEYACTRCKLLISSDDAYPEDPISWNINDDTYLAEQSQDIGDIFVMRSPFYTMAEFCSPCAPGAGYVSGGDVEDGVKTYCLDQDWYDEEYSPCEHHIYRVADDALVFCPVGETDACTCNSSE